MAEILNYKASRRRGEGLGGTVDIVPSNVDETDVGPESVNHPAHYGGDTTYETIKVIEAWDLGFNLGNAVKYISRAGNKGSQLEDLEKAAWYLQREIELLGHGADEG